MQSQRYRNVREREKSPAERRTAIFPGPRTHTRHRGESQSPGTPRLATAATANTTTSTAPRCEELSSSPPMIVVKPAQTYETSPPSSRPRCRWLVRADMTDEKVPQTKASPGTIHSRPQPRTVS